MKIDSGLDHTKLLFFIIRNIGKYKLLKLYVQRLCDWFSKFENCLYMRGIVCVLKERKINIKDHNSCEKKTAN